MLGNIRVISRSLFLQLIDFLECEKTCKEVHYAHNEILGFISCFGNKANFSQISKSLLELFCVVIDAVCSICSRITVY